MDIKEDFRQCQKLLNNSKKKQKKNTGKICIDQGSKLYSKSFKKWLEDNKKCVQHTMKGNLLLLKDLSEL